MSEFIEKLKSRRSVRSFKSEMPTKESYLRNYFRRFVCTVGNEQTAGYYRCRYKQRNA